VPHGEVLARRNKERRTINGIASLIRNRGRIEDVRSEIRHWRLIMQVQGNERIQRKVDQSEIFFKINNDILEWTAIIEF
jgi:hypothetical protein